MNGAQIRVAQIVGKMNRGGVEAVVMNYYRAIDLERVQFDFFVDETSSFPQREEIALSGGGIYLIPPYTRPIRMIRTLVRLFRKNQYSVVHSHLNTMNILPLFAAWLSGVRVRICHNHSTAHPGEHGKTLLKYALRPFARIFATHYFACGETSARWMFGSRLFDRNTIHLLPNAIDFSKFGFSSQNRSDVRAELGIATNDYVVGHIGRFIFQKNHAFLLRIFEALLSLRPNAILLLAGEGELLEKSRAQATAMGIESRILFLGGRDDTNRLYSAMDVFCLPSYYEGLPVVIVEALSNGLSCVISDHVTKELNAFSVQQLSLNQDAFLWAVTLINAQRSGSVSQTLADHYDVRLTAPRLEAFYYGSENAI